MGEGKEARKGRRIDEETRWRSEGEKVRGRQREREWEMRAHSRSGAWKRAIGEVTGWWRGCAVVLVLAERRERMEEGTVEGMGEEKSRGMERDE